MFKNLPEFPWDGHALSEKSRLAIIFFLRECPALKSLYINMNVCVVFGLCFFYLCYHMEPSFLMLIYIGLCWFSNYVFMQGWCMNMKHNECSSLVTFTILKTSTLILNLLRENLQNLPSATIYRLMFCPMEFSLDKVLTRLQKGFSLYFIKSYHFNKKYLMKKSDLCKCD